MKVFIEQPPINSASYDWHYVKNNPGGYSLSETSLVQFISFGGDLVLYLTYKGSEIRVELAQNSWNSSTYKFYKKPISITIKE